MSSWTHEKSALFRAVSDEISAETALFSADFAAMKNDFSALIRAESELFRDFHVMYSAELELKQRWSALIISKSEVISAEIL